MAPHRDDPDSIRREVERASRHYYHTAQQQGIDNRVKRFVVDRCMPHVAGPSVLELGYVDGLWTDRLVASGFAVTIVEGASAHVAHARERYPGGGTVQIAHCLFQEFEPDTQYQTIVAGDMIRYLADPATLLSRAREWLTDAGVLIATVPNSRSLHRRIGAFLNLQETPQALNQQDRDVGNLRGYDRYEFRHLLVQSGLTVRELRGCFLKPLSSGQMQDWSDELLEAFLHLGDELEDYSWFLYAVCVK